MELNDDQKKESFSRKVEKKEKRRIKAGDHRPEFWSGAAIFGLIGWSVVMPMLAGIALGIWIDRKFPGKHSWTLTLLIAGLALGCFNAWNWIMKENKNDNNSGQEEENE
jgi:ATP synthase protein I